LFEASSRRRSRRTPYVYDVTPASDFATSSGALHGSARSFDGVAMACRGDAVLVLWRAAATRSRVVWMGAQLEEAAKTAPNGTVMIQFILPSSNPPDAEARAASGEILRRLDRRLRHVVTVPLGDAMWMNIVRAVMRALMLVTGGSGQISVAAGAQGAFSRLRKFASHATPLDHVLADALAELYGALGVGASVPPSRGVPIERPRVGDRCRGD
jgi:hypothetical protein